MVARRQLDGGVDEEGAPRREGDAEGESIRPLHRRVAARREHAVRVASRFDQRDYAEYSYEQSYRLPRNRHFRIGIDSTILGEL